MERRAVELYRLSLFGRMAMGVAHEIDNHLSVILGFAELIQIAPGNEQKVRDGTGKILSAGEKTGAIIRHCSHYVRPHAPRPEPFAPGKMIPEILAFARYDLGRNNVVFSAPDTAPAGALRCDRGDLALALLALLFNGAEAMAGGGGSSPGSRTGRASVGAPRAPGGRASVPSRRPAGAPPAAARSAAPRRARGRTPLRGGRARPPPPRRPAAPRGGEGPGDQGRRPEPLHGLRHEPGQGARDAL